MRRIDQIRKPLSPQRAFKFRSLISLSFLIRLVLFSLVWGLLTGWQQSSLGVGIVFIFTASLLSLYLAPQQRKTKQWLKSPLSLLSFLLYFAVQSLRGGWNIAKLALTPKPKLSPGFVKYHTDLANESQVFTFMQVLSLLPGTVSAKQNGRELTIHVLDLNSFNHSEIDDCQMRIRTLLSTPNKAQVDDK